MKYTVVKVRELGTPITRTYVYDNHRPNTVERIKSLLSRPYYELIKKYQTNSRKGWE